MKKGFTLIELLAVIVILAVIALIATPIIINIINDSQEQSIKSSANLYVDGLSKYIVSRNMLGEFNPSSCTISNGNISCDDTSIDYTVDGKIPISGSIDFNNGVVSSYTLDFGDYTVTKNQNGISVAKSVPIVFNGTKVAATQNDTHKGIVYLDPTDLSTTCTAAIAATNLNTEPIPTSTGIKSGCMKFYIYDDSGSTYKMILDHNTTTGVPFLYLDDYITATGNTEATKDDVELSVGPITIMREFNADTEGWVGNPRLITADEVAHIVGADTALGWSSSKTLQGMPYLVTDINTQYANIYLDGSGNTYSGWETQVADSSNKSQYAWLYDNVQDCERYGCNIEEKNSYYSAGTCDYGGCSVTYGYWTSTMGSPSGAFAITYDGMLSNYWVEDMYYEYERGIRPVITLPKSIFN